VVRLASIAGPAMLNTCRVVTVALPLNQCGRLALNSREMNHSGITITAPSRK
jgi:hypothetical protein